MADSIVILAAAPSEHVSRVAPSDRAAVALGSRPIFAHAMAFCPCHDSEALQYARAAGIKHVGWLPTLGSVNFDVALVGLGALDAYGDALVGELAEFYNATLAVDVLDLQRDGHRWRVVKDAGRGDREELTVVGRMVLVVSELAVRPPYVSRHKRRIAAEETHDRPRFEQGTPRLTGANRGDWEPTRPRVKLGRRASYLDRSAESRLDLAFGAVDRASEASLDHVIRADAMTCGQYLLRYLAHHGFIDGREVGADTGDSMSPKPVNHMGARETIVETPPTTLGNRRLARSPRQVGGHANQVGRRPRPYVSNDRTASGMSPMPAKVARRPRLAQNEGRQRVRGPRAID